MAVNLYTNTRPQEIHNEDRSLLKKKPRELCLGFTPQSQKCFKSRHKMLHFWSMSNNGKVATQNLRGELNLLRRMKVTTDNSATMASGHFYESICMAHHQEPPSPDLQPQVYVQILGVTHLNVLLYSREIKFHTLTEHVNIMFASHFPWDQFWAIINNLSKSANHGSSQLHHHGEIPIR